MPLKPTRYKTVEVKTGLAFIACGLTWIVYALIFPMYRIFDFLIIGILSLIVFIVTDKLAPKKTKNIEITDEPLVTGIPTADEIIRIGQEFIAEIELTNQNIKNPEINGKIKTIIELLEKILELVKNDPDDARNIKPFMNYYLPTIAKLASYYQTFEKQNIAGENISASMDKISELFDTASSAFQKTLDRMFADEALDITTDITGMENMLASRGLTNDVLNINIKEKL